MLPIRLLQQQDASAALRLSNAAGWNQTEAFWSQLIAYQPEGCFAVERNNKLIATITTTSYADSVAWIGMMLVDADHRRQGIATELMRRAIRFLEDRHRVRTIKLDATPAGAAVYRRLGFCAEHRFSRWKRDADQPAESIGSFSLSVCDALGTEQMTIDRDAFAADRGEWLKQLAERSECVVTDNGFGLCRAGQTAWQIGPVIVQNHSAGESILAALLHRCRRNPLIWDVYDPRAEPLAESLGFVPVREFVRMSRGTDSQPQAASFQYAIGDPSTG